MSNKPFLYPQFLSYLVQYYNSYQVNSAICRHIIYSQMQLKSKAGANTLDQKKR